MIYHRFCTEVSLLANKENCKISKANLTILSRGGLSYYKRPLFEAFRQIEKGISAGAEEEAHTPPPSSPSPPRDDLLWFFNTTSNLPENEQSMARNL